MSSRKRYEILKAFNGRCLLCGRGAAEGAVLHVDHIVPRSKRPDLADVLDNFQVLCDKCNLGKGNRDDTSWAQYVRWYCEDCGSHWEQRPQDCSVCGSGGERIRPWSKRLWDEDAHSIEFGALQFKFRQYFCHWDWSRDRLMQRLLGSEAGRESYWRQARECGPLPRRLRLVPREKPDDGL